MRAVVPRVTALRVVVGALRLAGARGNADFRGIRDGFSSARRLARG